jgi:pilus assembly protein CpaC
VELDSGQSFVIAGLLDNRTAEVLNKIPGLSNIPLIGKIFESRSLQKSNSELMVLVTPEIVDPIGAGGKRPDLVMPKPFMKDAPAQAPQNPVKTNAKLPSVETIPVEVIKRWTEPDPNSSGGNGAAAPAGNMPAPSNAPNPMLNAKTGETGGKP